MLGENENGYWTTIITPKPKLLVFEWEEMWRYRDMFTMTVKRSFQAAYKQTILGPLWFIITPVLSIIVYIAVFGGVAKIPTDGIPPALFYLLGISVWSFFGGCLSSTSYAFVSFAGLYSKIYFPRLLMPLAAVTSNFLYFLVQLAIFFAFYAYYAIEPIINHQSTIINYQLAMHWQAILFLPLLALLALLGMGFGMMVSIFMTKYRDLQVMFAKFVNLWVYITPVIYPMSMVTDERLLLAMRLNPVAPIMEAIKYSLLGQGQFSWPWLGYSALCTVVFCLLGLLIFNKAQVNFVDTV